MNRRPGLQSHPSLPQAPHVAYNNPVQTAQNTYYQYQQPSVLYAQPGPSNPHSYYVSSHYAQAYMQAGPMPSQGNINISQSQYYTPTAGLNHSQSFSSRPSASWAQPGNTRCKQQGCAFTGSPKSVEIHMMDRHLIYPAGWEKRKRKPDWDADPSLKGKSIPIQGTNIKLDTPEAIEQWIAERKKRFPTAERVVEKKAKLDEAISRGQLPFEEARFPNKKRRVNEGRNEGRSDSRPRDTGFRGRGRGRDRGRGRVQFNHGRNLGTPPSVPAQVPQGQNVTKPDALDISEDPDKNHANEKSDSDSDGAPEMLSSKPTIVEQDIVQPIEPRLNAVATSEQRVVRKPAPRQPRRPVQNPFASRPALLRNLLLPEIRMTVSNLSQAIRFLVDNDFLDNVELRPGQTNEKMIEVISTSDAVVDAPKLVDNALTRQMGV